MQHFKILELQIYEHNWEKICQTRLMEHGVLQVISVVLDRIMVWITLFLSPPEKLYYVYDVTMIIIASHGRMSELKMK